MKTLLLVEDEPLLAATEKMQLEQYGYRILHADTGETAVTMMANSPGIELILMDINLGKGIDGTEAARIILESNDIPIVFLSSHTQKEIVEKTEKISSYGYVVKNSSITVLDASIKMAFKLFDSKKKTRDSELLWRAIAETSTEKKQAEHEIEHQIKELQTFYSLTKLSQRKNITQEELYQEVANLLSTAWKSPHPASVKLAIGKKTFYGDHFSESPWQQSATIKINGREEGRVDLYYKEHPTMPHGTGVVQEEKKLLKAIADQVGTFAENLQAEAVIAKTNQFLNASLQSPDTMINFSIDQNYRYLYFNNTYIRIMKKLYGITIANDQPFLDSITNPEDRKRAKAHFDRAFAGESHTFAEAFGELETRYFESTYSPIRDSSGSIMGVALFGQDITERKKTEDALAKTSKELCLSNELLERTGEMAKVGGWELDLATTEVTYSKEAARIHEVGYPYVPDKLSQGSEYYPPEAWPMVQAAVQRAIEYGTPYEFESPFITAKGNRI